MSNQKSTILSFLKWAALGLVLANGWIGWTCWIHRDQALAAQNQVQHLLALAKKIESLRQNPVRVEQGARTGEALARIVESAARQVELNPEQIVRIDPGELRQLGDSPYFEQRTDIELREASLQKIVEFTMAVEGSETSMDVPTLSLRVPSGPENPAGTEELWNAQLLLTSRIYQPKMPASLTPQNR